ncbi:Ribose-phosphate pyrophosphokinase 2 [Smittium mucronatum]|uniref:ribose-phosphate diphosphokinase n=1 Tax=Smittium mucronatum TaxID=133383 RepID=A0A1R0GLG3_9FUNG|nr:Ribose-phosphate pyrophosphokinase 2 [Smittium mucronatum]
MQDIALIAGSSHHDLARLIAQYLGIAVTPTKLGKFSNMETRVEIQKSVRNKHVYILQSGGGNVNDDLIELLIIIQACRFGSAEKISVVTPLLMYSMPMALRKEPLVENIDTKIVTGYKSWEARPGRLITNLLEAAGTNHLIAMDLHQSEYQGFFSIPVDIVYAEPVIIEYIRKKIPNYQNAVVVSPDAGGAKRAASICNKLDLQFALIHNTNQTTSPLDTSNGVYHRGSCFIGDAVDRPIILIDDISITGNTLDKAADILKRGYCADIYAIVIHGCFTNKCVELLETSPITRVACTNSIALNECVLNSPKIDVIDVSVILGETIRRTFNGESVSQLYNRDTFE